MTMTMTPQDALRAVLAQNAKIPHLEAEIAHLRKHDASDELDAVLDALNEHPASPDIGDLPMADQVRLIIKWWDETEVENNDAHNTLDELCAPDEGTAAERIRALAAEKDKRIAELEAIRAALAESPVPNAPADCDLAGWVRYILRAWEGERREASNLAELCQGAHVALDGIGAPDEGSPAERIWTLAQAHRQRIAELEDKVRALSAERTQERPDYLVPGSGELACPKCGAIVYWRMWETRNGDTGGAHCARSTYTARAPSMPMIGDGGCDWRGQVRRVGGRVEIVT